MHAVNPLKTPAFKRFFRDSAVIDRDGRPMVVYHGTTAGDFEAFRPHYRKDEQVGFGIHFAESYELADMYAHDPTVRRRGVKRPRVIGAYLSVQRPLYADRVVFEGTLEYALALELARHRNMPMERDEKGRRMLYMQACIDATGVERAERLIRKAGYDGVCYTATMMDGGRIMGGGSAWVVFEPNQIKSTDNVGTYNPEDPRMRHNAMPPFQIAERIDMPRKNPKKSPPPKNKRGVRARRRERGDDQQLLGQIAQAALLVTHAEMQGLPTARLVKQLDALLEQANERGLTEQAATAAMHGYSEAALAEEHALLTGRTLPRRTSRDEVFVDPFFVEPAERLRAAKKYTPKRGEVLVVNALPSCNFCRTRTPGVYDFRTTDGSWANACEEHYQIHRASPTLGVGQGQRLITRDQVRENRKRSTQGEY